MNTDAVLWLAAVLVSLAALSVSLAALFGALCLLARVVWQAWSDERQL
jgi:hypothetical protein